VAINRTAVPAPKQIGHPREVRQYTSISLLAEVRNRESINRYLQQMVRVQAGKKENPTVAIADSQSGKHTGEIGQHLQVLYVGRGYTMENDLLRRSQLAGAKVECQEERSG
jgi:hypothetical protein